MSPVCRESVALFRKHATAGDVDLTYDSVIFDWVRLPFPMPNYLEQRLADALARNLDVLTAGNSWYSIPARWRDDLLDRTRERDDGHALELIAQAMDRWVPT